MRQREFYYRWEWLLQASPQALWPLVSDTNRLNRNAGMPPVENRHGDEASLTNARRRLRCFRLGVALEWEAEPYEWVRPYRFGVVCRYSRGPIAETRVLAELTPQPGGGSRLVYQVWAQPKTVLGLIAIPVQIGWLCARSFDATVRWYDQLATDGKLPLDQPGRIRFASGGRVRLATLRGMLVAQGAAPELVARLIETIEQADELTLARLRPYVLADYWGVSRRAVLELCLLATRAGLLDLQWHLLCPLCRGAKHSSPTLAGIQSQVHCDSCHIDFTVNLDRLVELTFRPNPAVRKIDSSEFCVGGPQVTPHIVAQQLLPPGSQRTVTLPLEEGRYRLRTPGLPGCQLALVTTDGLPAATFHASAMGWSHEELRLAPVSTLRFDNATDSEQLFSLERMAWTDQAVTAAEVIAMQRFRDLFANEVLRPGERISVGSLTVLFTDLCDSTRLYRTLGDAPAFGRVIDHFEILRKAIAVEEGTVVKTIGDAVMAVFRSPAAALRVVRSAQQALASPVDGERPLLLKAGIHYGPCIAVTLNDRLDYFGTTVNLAARLNRLSSGGDIIVSAAVCHDPEVAELFAQPDSGVVAEPIEAVLKGFDEERFELWRVTPVGSSVNRLEPMLVG